MAHPIPFLGCNLTLGTARDDVANIRVMRNRAMVISCWQLSETELQEVARTERIFLASLGKSMPPTYLGAESLMRNFSAEYGPLPKQGL